MLTLLLFTSCILSNAQVQFNDEINADEFQPATIYTRSDSVFEGHVLIPWPQVNTVLYVKDIKGETVNKDQWTNYASSKLSKINFEKGTTLYSIRPRGSAGLALFLYKLHENSSITFYAGVPSQEELIKAGKTIIFLQKKGEDRAERMIFNFREYYKPMIKKVVKNIGKCDLLKQEVESGNYKKSVEDFIKLLDFYDHNCHNLNNDNSTSK